MLEVLGYASYVSRCDTTSTGLYLSVFRSVTLRVLGYTRGLRGLMLRVLGYTPYFQGSMLRVLGIY